MDFESHRPGLTSFAYRMLGSVADAEEVVQEAWLRWKDAGEPRLDEPRAWLTRTCARLCVDRLKSARRTREEYVGVWLPEPLTDEDRAELDDSLSMALLLTLERLRPAERAAFLLHDVFGYEFTEVAEMLDLEPANCRQLAVRARQHVRAERPRANADAASVERLSNAFFTAARTGELELLRSVLADDVVLRADGGGKVPATLRPIEGAAAVARFFLGVFRKAPPVTLFPRYFNGAPGIVVLEDSTPISAFQFTVDDDAITAIHVQRNPDKLARFSP